MERGQTQEVIIGWGLALLVACIILGWYLLATGKLEGLADAFRGFLRK